MQGGIISQLISCQLHTYLVRTLAGCKRSGVLCGLSLQDVTPGPVGHVFASLGNILQWGKGSKNVCYLRTDVYFGCAQIHNFVEYPRIRSPIVLLFFWKFIQYLSFSPPCVCAGPKVASKHCKLKSTQFEPECPECCLIWAKRAQFLDWPCIA